MINEYAFEPALFCNWDNCRYLSTMIGFPKGRVISKFPSSWPKVVLNSISQDCSPINRKRIEEKLTQLKPCMINSNRDYDSHMDDWMSHACRAHNLVPFKAIIASSNSSNNSSILTITDIENNNELWEVEHSAVSLRDSEKIAKSLSLMLLICKKIIIVEPFFKPAVRVFRDTVINIINIIQSAERRCGMIQEIHIIKKYDSSEHDYKLKCENHLKKYLTKGSSIHFLCCSEIPGGQEFHNRFVLTDNMGINLGQGLDGQPNCTSTDDVFILDNNHYQNRWDMYNNVRNHFKVDLDFTITC